MITVQPLVSTGITYAGKWNEHGFIGVQFQVVGVHERADDGKRFTNSASSGGLIIKCVMSIIKANPKLCFISVNMARNTEAPEKRR